MLQFFKQGSIRWHIVTLAVLPLLLLFILEAITDPLTPDDSDLSRAEYMAAQIALVANQVENADSSELTNGILQTTRESGLPVQQIDLMTQPSVEGSTFHDRVVYALSSVYNRTAWSVAGDSADLLIVVEMRNGLLEFLPTVFLGPNITNDFIADMLLQFTGVVLPMVMLSIYAARLITDPLTRIAAAAQGQSSAAPTEQVFDESGPREIRQLGRRLNEMHLHIRGMLEERTAMLRAVGHDLRTPLTRLQLRIERSVPAETTAILMRDIKAINEMINDTLNYLRSDNKTEPFRKTDMPSLLRTICSDFSDVGFTVTYFGPDRLTFSCRSRALARAVSNLIDNGTKFGKNVVVVLTSLPEGAVRIDVSDDGHGLPEDMRTKVLEPFVKADASRSSSSRSGFGLGLAIVQEVARGHGGTLSLHPSDPNGLTATIILPGKQNDSLT